MHFHGHGYSASGNLEPLVRFDETLTVLHTRGVVFDVVAEVDPLCSSGRSASEIVGSARLMLSGIPPDGTGLFGTVTDELLRTVLRTRSFVDAETLRSEDLVIETIMDKRRFFVTAGSRLYIGPSDIRPGDAVSILAGCNFPMVLWRRGEVENIVVGEAYGRATFAVLIGSAYVLMIPVHNGMAGEVLEDRSVPGLEWKELSLC